MGTQLQKAYDDAEEVECPECNGAGYLTESGHGCNGTDEDCYRTCPVPVQAHCDFCGDEGIILQLKEQTEGEGDE